MPTRVESIADRFVDGPVSVDVAVPDGARHIMVVIERKPLERFGDVPICAATVMVGERRVGRVKWNGGRADFSRRLPGRVALWTYGRFEIQAPGDTATILFEPVQPHYVTAHVEFH